MGSATTLSNFDVELKYPTTLSKPLTRSVSCTHTNLVGATPDLNASDSVSSSNILKDQSLTSNSRKLFKTQSTTLLTPTPWQNRSRSPHWSPVSFRVSPETPIAPWRKQRREEKSCEPEIKIPSSNSPTPWRIKVSPNNEPLPWSSNDSYYVKPSVPWRKPRYISQSTQDVSSVVQNSAHESNNAIRIHGNVSKIKELYQNTHRQVPSRSISFGQSSYARKKTNDDNNDSEWVPYTGLEKLSARPKRNRKGSSNSEYVKCMTAENNKSDIKTSVAPSVKSNQVAKRRDVFESTSNLDKDTNILADKVKRNLGDSNRGQKSSPSSKSSSSARPNLTSIVRRSFEAEKNKNLPSDLSKLESLKCLKLVKVSASKTSLDRSFDSEKEDSNNKSFIQNKSVEVSLPVSSNAEVKSVTCLRNVQKKTPSPEKDTEKDNFFIRSSTDLKGFGQVKTDYGNQRDSLPKLCLTSPDSCRTKTISQSTDTSPDSQTKSSDVQTDDTIKETDYQYESLENQAKFNNSSKDKSPEFLGHSASAFRDQELLNSNLTENDETVTGSDSENDYKTEDICASTVLPDPSNDIDDADENVS